MVIVEEWFDTNHIFPTPRKEVVYLNNRYMERNYVMDGEIAVLDNIRNITKSEFFDRVNKKLDKED